MISSCKMSGNLKDIARPDPTMEKTLSSNPLEVPCFIQPFVFGILQFTGMHPQSRPPDAKMPPTADTCSSPPRSSINPYLGVISAFIMVALILGLIGIISGDFSRRLWQMNDLEFFTLITFMVQSTDLIAAPAMLALMIWHSRRLPHLLANVQNHFCKLCPTENIYKIRYAVLLLCGWHLACITTLMMFQHEFNVKNRLVLGAGDKNLPMDNVSSDWTTLVEYPFVGTYVEMPFIVGTILGNFFFVCTSNCHFIPQYLVIIMGLALSVMCNQISKDIHIAAEIRKPLFQVSVLSQSRLNFRTVKSLVNQVNHVFAMIVLISCVRDMLIAICLLATLLSKIAENCDAPEEVIRRAIISRDTYKIILYWLVATDTGLAGVRLSVFMNCNTKASTIRRKIQCLQADITDDTVDDECSRFLGEIGETDTSISGGGFFNVSKEYLATMTGLLFTYVVLIYQTRDQKEDMSNLMTAQELTSRLDNLSRELARNALAIVRSCNASAAEIYLELPLYQLNRTKGSF